MRELFGLKDIKMGVKTTKINHTIQNQKQDAQIIFFYIINSWVCILSGENNKSQLLKQVALVVYKTVNKKVDPLLLREQDPGPGDGDGCR